MHSLCDVSIFLSLEIERTCGCRADSSNGSMIVSFGIWVSSPGSRSATVSPLVRLFYTNSRGTHHWSTETPNGANPNGCGPKAGQGQAAARALRVLRCRRGSPFAVRRRCRSTSLGTRRTPTGPPVGLSWTTHALSRQQSRYVVSTVCSWLSCCFRSILLACTSSLVPRALCDPAQPRPDQTRPAPQAS